MEEGRGEDEEGEEDEEEEKDFILFLKNNILYLTCIYYCIYLTFIIVFNLHLLYQPTTKDNECRQFIVFLHYLLCRVARSLFLQGAIASSISALILRPVNPFRVGCTVDRIQASGHVHNLASLCSGVSAALLNPPSSEPLFFIHPDTPPRALNSNLSKPRR